MKYGLDIIKEYLPAAYGLISQSGRIKTTIAKYYERRLASIEKAIREKGVFSAKTTMYDLLWEAMESNKSTIAFLSFIDKTIENLVSKLDERGRSQLRNLCLRMFITFNEYDSQYKNHFAELATLSSILSEPTFIFQQIEKRLPNGKSFDFAFQRKGSEILIEVYNIDFTLEKIESTEKFVVFLKDRLEKKLQYKLSGLTEPLPGFVITPVLWGKNKELQPFADALVSFKEYDIVGPFMMIAEYKGPNGEYIYDFQPVTHFLEQVEKIEKRRTDGGSGAIEEPTLSKAERP